jgi:hypothetical protein
MWRRRGLDLVRTDDELARIRVYIADNPKNWMQDGLNAAPP